MRDLVKRFGLLKIARFIGLRGMPGAVRNPHGHVKTTGPYGEVFDGDTLQCCHCGGHWEVVVGSGRVRGWCHKCLAHHCGKPECWECVPYEKQIENIEAGRPKLASGPPKIFVP